MFFPDVYISGSMLRTFCIRHKIIHSLTHPPTHSLTHPPTHSLTHQLTHSLPTNRPTDRPKINNNQLSNFDGFVFFSDGKVTIDGEQYKMTNGFNQIEVLENLRDTMANMKETLENDPLPGKILYIFRIH
jgi:hypothetical protein